MNQPLLVFLSSLSFKGHPATELLVFTFHYGLCADCVDVMGHEPSKESHLAVLYAGNGMLRALSLNVGLYGD